MSQPGVPKRVSLSAQIGVGLAAGLGLGLAASASGDRSLLRVAVAVEPIGAVWINSIRMVVIPLVVAALVSGVAGLGGVGRLGRLGVRTLAFFWVTTLVAILLGLLLALAIVPLAPLSPEATVALREAAARGARETGPQIERVPSLVQFLVDLVPSNPLKAAADGALLPVIVFSVLFGAAVASLEEARRRSVTDLADAVVAALIRLIAWIMVLAPLGIACLAAPVAARFGWGMLRSLGIFIAVVVGGLLLFATAVYGGAVALLARVRLGAFARAIAPAQAVGFSTTSSMAALPAMMDAAVRTIGISSPVASFVLPLGATINRTGSGLYQAVAAVFVASLYGVDLGITRLAVVASSAFLMSLSVAAIPAASVLTLAPTLLAAGLPVEGVGLLLGVDRIPDMFRTATHVTGHLTAAAVVARGEGERLEQP